MTTPRDRVSFGYHTFPFFGLQAPGREAHPLPLIPLRARGPGGSFGRPFNAILDTGSTSTLIPERLAARNGLSKSGVERALSVIGAQAKGTEAGATLAIVDAHYPEVNCWEVADTVVLVMKDDDLEIPVLGWNILGLFEFTMDRRRQRISMKLHTE